MELEKGVSHKLKNIFDKNYRFRKMASFGMFDKMEDREYLEKLFRSSMRNTLNLDNPQTFNEKLQWLKLYNRKPEYTLMI